MSLRRFIFLLIFLPVAGAGCSWTTPIVSPQISEPLGQTFEYTPIVQFKGFGQIPDVPGPVLKPGTQGTVRIEADLPSLPSRSAVLRVKSGRPNATQLENVANTFGIPASVIGPHPTGYEATLEWKDDQDVRWIAHANEHRLDFRNEAVRQSTLTLSTWPDTKPLIEAVQSFIREHGIGLQHYGPGFIEPDWKSWWEVEMSRGHCMTVDTVNSIRTLSSSETFGGFPALPDRRRATCIDPEFPATVQVRFSATQDGQAIFADSGTPVLAGSLIIDGSTQKLMSGWLTLPQDPDRSDYELISQEQARTRLASGGQGGTPRGDVVIRATSLDWYQVEDNRLPSTRYLYPALVGHGTIQYADQTTAPYRIIMPLVK